MVRFASVCILCRMGSCFEICSKVHLHIICKARVQQFLRSHSVETLMIPVCHCHNRVV